MRQWASIAASVEKCFMLNTTGENDAIHTITATYRITAQIGHSTQEKGAGACADRFITDNALQKVLRHLF